MLLKAKHGGKFGDRYSQHIAILQQNGFGILSAQQAGELCLNPFRRDSGQQAPVPMDGLGCVRLQTEAKNSGKAQGAEDAQSVLLKAEVGLSHAADDSGGDVGYAAAAVHQSGGGAPGQRVHGEVPADQVLLQAGGELDPIRAAVVGVSPVHPKGRDLQGQALQQDGDGAVLQTGLHQAAVVEYLLHLFRKGVCGHVPVLPGGRAPDPIPDRSPYHIGVEARRRQAAQGGIDLWRQRRGIHRRSPF